MKLKGAKVTFLTDSNNTQKHTSVKPFSAFLGNFTGFNNQSSDVPGCDTEAGISRTRLRFDYAFIMNARNIVYSLENFQNLFFIQRLWRC